MGKINYIISFRKRLFWRSLLLGLFFCTCALNATSTLEQQEDSLQNILSLTADPTRKIEIVRRLAVLNNHTPKEVGYSMQMLELANQVDSMHYGYEAIFYLCRYYCNTYQLDSLCYWVDAMDSITTVRKELPDELFSAHNALCRLYMIRGEYEIAMNEAVKQQILSERVNNKLGLVSCNENWGLIYMCTNRYEEAAQAFTSCISLLENMEDKSPYIIQVNECLIQTYLYLKDYKKTEKALDYQEEVLRRMKAEGNPIYKNFPYDEIYFILEAYRVRLYSEMNMPEKAHEAIRLLTPYKSYSSMSYILSGYNLAMASYYYMMKDYKKALDFINGKLDLDIPYFELKAAIFAAMGRDKDVLKVHQQYMEFGRSQRNVAFTRQISQLRSIQNQQEEEKSIQRLALQEKELHNKRTQLGALILLSAILLIFLALWVWYLVRIRKLKNILVKEQAALSKTNLELQAAREKAENAERMKSNFIANMSHEIRTPLNTIVGFADMLKDSNPEEQVEYIGVINNSTDLLLNLVSGVLDLSRLSDTDFTLNIQQVNLEECCQHALSTVRNSILPGVKAVFTHPDEPFVMNTDSLRLQQLLVNLLGNAIKFTEKGEIVLAYKVDQTTSSVLFSVTDTGCGIPLEKQETIFKRFEKANDFKQGTGLGLSICQAIARRFGGRLFVDPTYTSGARFIFEMPLESNTD